MASATENSAAADGSIATTTTTVQEQQQLHQLKKRVRHRSVADGKSMYFGKYVSQEGSEKLLTYQYHGSDNSLIYQHVLTPMNNFLVEFLPLWLAPNLVCLFVAACLVVWLEAHTDLTLACCASAADYADRAALGRDLAPAVCDLLSLFGRRCSRVVVCRRCHYAVFVPGSRS